MILLSWCSSSSKTTIINFDNLKLTLKSSKLYIAKDINKTTYPWILAYQESWWDTKDTFINSLIITSQSNLDLKIKDFVNQNIESLKTSIWSITIQSTKTLPFVCSGIKITWMIKNFKITEATKYSYFSQFFFIDENKWYIISFEADNQDDTLDFKNSLSSLSCIK